MAVLRAAIAWCGEKEHRAARRRERASGERLSSALFASVYFTDHTDSLTLSSKWIRAQASVVSRNPPAARRIMGRGPTLLAQRVRLFVDECNLGEYWSFSSGADGGR